MGLQAVLGASQAAAVSIVFNVTTTTDIAANAGACGNNTIVAPPDPSNLSLREATCLANNNGGTVTINIPAGTYTLSHGELAPGIHTGQNVTLAGAGAASTIISGNNASRVLDLDKNLVGGVTAAISGVTITGGADSTFGGAGIIAGSGNVTTADSLDISSSKINDNQANGSALTSTNNPGGGVQFIGGTLTIESSTISNNGSHSSPGSGVFYEANGATGGEHLTISGTTFSGNTMTNTNGTSVTNGGALDVRGPLSAPLSVTNSIFVNNSVVATTGGAVGGAIRQESGALTVTGSTFTGNSVSGGATTAAGGAIDVTTGTATLHYNRIVGNTAAAGSGIFVGTGAGAVDATENWFGCNGGPGTTGCDTVVAAPPATATTNPRLFFNVSQVGSTVTGPNASHTVTGFFTADSAAGVVSGSNLGVFASVSVNWTDPEPSPATIEGSTTSASTTFNSGTTSANYNSQSSSGVGHIVAGVDNASLTLPITVNRPPTITLQPTDQTVNPNTSVSFSATADGFPAPTVQWFVSTDNGQNFTSIGGATSTTYTHTAVSTENGYKYHAVFTNSVTSATTNDVTLTVGGPPSFTSASSTNFPIGTAGTFGITTSGFPAPSLGTTGTLPAWLTFTDNGDGTGSLTGTPPPGSAGAHTFTLTATNGHAPDATQSFTLDVTQPPTISSANSHTFVAGTSGSFAVTSTAGFPTATTMSESGSLPSGVTFTDNGDGTATLAGTPAAGSGGTYPITLTATNSAGHSDQAFTLTVDQPPTISSGDHTTFSKGSFGTFAVTTTGAIPAATTISKSGSLPSGVTFTDNGNGTATLAGTPTTAGSFPLTITATNGVSPDAVQSFTLTVTSVPVFSSANNTTFTVGSSGSFSVTTTPGFPTPRTVTESGSLPSGVTFTDNGDGTATLSGTPAAGTGGGYPVTLTVTNTAGHTDQAFTLTVDQPPTISSGDHTTFSAGTAGSFAITTTGAIPTATTITQTGTLPSGVTFTDNGNGTATLAGTPTNAGVFPLTITATNGVSPDAVQSFTLTVTSAPVFSSANNTTFTVGSNGSFSVTTTPGVPAATTLSESGSLPSGVTFADNGDGTGVLAGTPAAGSGGTYPITLTATNSAGHSDQSFTLTVNQPPTISSGDHTTFSAGTAGSFAITTTGAVPTATTITQTGTLPSGVTFTDNGNGTATLAGTPTAAGSFPLTITAANGVSPNAVQSFTLTVTSVPVFSSANNTTFKAGTNGSFSITTTPGFPTATTMSESGSLPDGVTFTDNGDGTATLAGTPAAGSGGTYPLTLTATNTTGHTDQAFTLTVNESPSITSGAGTTFSVATFGTFTVTTGHSFPADPSLSENGALPTGVTFVDNGDGTATLAGTPAADTGGLYSIAITASNGVSPDVIQGFSLSVDQAPVISSADHATFTVGTAGSFTVTTNGFPEPGLTKSGALPTGVTFSDNGDGTASLSGTPADGTAASYPLSITAANGISPDAQQSFTLTVVKQAQTITMTSTPPSPAIVGGTYDLTATSDSGLTVAFTIDGATTNSACSIGGATVSFDHTGSCVMDANQAGDGTYSAAPQEQQTVTVAAVATGVGLATTPTSTVFGQSVTATATITADSGTPAGSVQFAVDGTDFGSPVTVSGGTATSPPLTDSSAAPLTPASHAITAHFAPTDTTTYSTADGSYSLVVAKASTTTAVTVNPSTVVATVTASPPGAGTPTGTVSFTANGNVLGSASLSGGVATLHHAVPSGSTAHVAATYAGDGDFTGSSASTARHDPSITARVSSAHRKTRFGWYRSAVKVTFHCTTHGAPLSASCPSPAHLTHNGGSQSVTRTIHATNGGVATVVVSPINIDQTAPRVRVTGIHNGATYNGTVPPAHCVAKDPLSGVASCTLSRHTSGTLTTFRAKATDRAGNTTSITGSYRTLGILFQGVPFSHGAFTVKRGHSYTLVVPAGSRPTYYDAAPYPAKPFQPDPHAFVHAGHHRWVLGITMVDLQSHKYWNLGVKIGHTMHVIKIRVMP